MLTSSKIWRLRLENIGTLNQQIAKNYGLSGPVLRSAGHIADQRLSQPYETFTYCNITTVYGQNGDNFTRFFIRLEELFISMQYVSVLLNVCLKTGGERSNKKKLTMEETIYRFKEYSEGYNIKSNKNYTSIESPKGEFGVSLVSNKKLPNRPYRLKVRSPGYYNLSSLNIVCSNYILSDLLSYLSTLDLILGEIDK